MQNSVHIHDGFFKGAKRLRRHFDSRFADPHSAEADRFVWDYWHVPAQYTVLRTPAYHFFPAPIYRALHERLVLWGRENLGCHDISPPWLSCYVDGCRQEFHADLPHGPWAFVYSLTPWETRRFTGGETMLLQPEILDYWSHLDRFAASGLEEAGVLRAIEPRFNRLTVFDPRIPHGVRRVEGTSDPREARLVVHGWFVQPRPFIAGPLPPAALQAAIEILLAKMDPLLRGNSPLRGIISLRFTVSAAGATSRLRILSNTLKALDRDESAVERLLGGIRDSLTAHRFPKRKSASQVTLPLTFGL